MLLDWYSIISCALRRADDEGKEAPRANICVLTYSGLSKNRHWVEKEKRSDVVGETRMSYLVTS